jgi:hypothetical protein
MVLPAVKRGQGLATGGTAAGALLAEEVVCATAGGGTQYMANSIDPANKDKCTRSFFCTEVSPFPLWVGVKRVDGPYLGYSSD